MSIYKKPNAVSITSTSKLKGHRFHGSTECTTRREAEAVEAVERDKAKALVKAMTRSRTSLLIDDVADRFWDQSGQHDAEPDATSKNLARLIEYFGKQKPLTDIDQIEARKMVAWRRGHRIKGRADAPLIANATVNRSATKVLERLFTFAKARARRSSANRSGANYCCRSRWSACASYRTTKRRRSMMRCAEDYGPFFGFVRASGLRQAECITLRWSEVNFGTQQIVRIGKGGRRVTFPITDTIREILFPLQGQHAEFVFTYVAVYGNKRLGTCAASVTRSPSPEPSPHGRRCAARRASRTSVSTTTGTTSAPSCCARPAT